MFITVMIPYDFEEDSKTIVSGIHIGTIMDMEATIKLHWITKTAVNDIQVNMDVHGTWTVKRN